MPRTSRRVAERNPGKNFGGSSVSNSRSGNHGFSRNDKRKPIKAMTTPKGVDNPGSGIGVQNGNASKVSSNVYPRPRVISKISRSRTGRLANAATRRSISSESRSGLASGTEHLQQPPERTSTSAFACHACLQFSRMQPHALAAGKNVPPHLDVLLCRQLLAAFRIEG